METGFVKMAASTYLHFIRTNYILLRRDIFVLYIKRKISHFQKKLLIRKTSRKGKNHFLTLGNNFPSFYHRNQTQTQTNKITWGPWMHHLGIITPTQLLLLLKHIYFNHNQMQKKSYPQKRKLSFEQLFHQNRLKHNPIQDQCQSNWFQRLNNLSW